MLKVLWRPPGSRTSSAPSWSSVSGQFRIGDKWVKRWAYCRWVDNSGLATNEWKGQPIAGEWTIQDWRQMSEKVSLLQVSWQFRIGDTWVKRWADCRRVDNSGLATHEWKGEPIAGEWTIQDWRYMSEKVSRLQVSGQFRIGDTWVKRWADCRRVDNSGLATHEWKGEPIAGEWTIQDWRHMSGKVSRLQASGQFRTGDTWVKRWADCRWVDNSGLATHEWKGEPIAGEWTIQDWRHMSEKVSPFQTVWYRMQLLNNESEPNFPWTLCTALF